MGNAVHLLTAWNQSWSLQTGEVRCRRCQFSQLQSNRSTAFAHGDQCPRHAQVDDPWGELDELSRVIAQASPRAGW